MCHTSGVAVMVPAGYMAKKVMSRPEWLDVPCVSDIYSVSGCMSKYFADYSSFWEHNVYWFFNSPDIITRVARENAIDLSWTTLFYYEVYGLQFDADSESWLPVEPFPSLETTVGEPSQRRLEGFDVVTYFMSPRPGCSPLSCNHLASEITTNSHCLLESLDDAIQHLTSGKFRKGEPGPYRIFAVYTV